MKAMTPKERMVALIRGREADQLPFVAYHWISGADDEARRELGDDSFGVLGWGRAYGVQTPNCREHCDSFTTDDGHEGWTDRIVTPKGTLVQKRLKVPALGGPTGFAEHYVKTPADLEVLLAYVEDWRVTEDVSPITEFTASIGQQGIPHVSLPRTPFQQLWIEWALIDDLACLMADVPDLVEAVMTKLGERLMETAKVTAAAAGKAEFYHVVIGDNVTAPIIGTRLFEKWCVPYYNRIADILAAAGVPLFIHMDGDLKALWGSIDGCRFKGFDSLSPPPDNDTPVGEALARWPDKMIWANFPSSVHLRQPAEIRCVAEELLAQGGHTRRFWIQISEDMPPGAWRKSFPEIVAAVRDFGKP